MNQSVKFQDDNQEQYIEQVHQHQQDSRAARSARQLQGYSSSACGVRGQNDEQWRSQLGQNFGSNSSLLHQQYNENPNNDHLYSSSLQMRSETAGNRQIRRRTLQKKYGSELPQPFGSGNYTNQLELRTSQLKKGVEVFGSTNQAWATAKSSTRRPQSTASVKNAGESFSAHLQSQRVQAKLREKLYFDERTKTVPKSTIKNDIIEKILSDGEVFVANKQLMHSVYQLKTLHLLKQNQSHINRYSGVGKFPFVFNDYHSRSTNNGYSRQDKGGFFFTK